LKKVIVFSSLLSMSCLITAMQSQVLEMRSTSVFDEGTGAINSVGFINANRFVSGSASGGVSIFDIAQRNARIQLPIGGSVKAVAAVQPNVLYVATSNANYPLFFNYDTGASLGVGRVTQDGHAQEILALAVIDPRSVITASADGVLVILHNSMAAKILRTEAGTPVLATANPNLVLATSYNSHTIYMINPVSGAISSLPIPAGYEYPTALAVVSPTRWAIGLADGKIVVLDSTTGKNEMRVLQGAGVIRGLSPITPNYVVSVQNDTAWLWNAQTGQKVAQLKRPSGQARALSVATQIVGQTVKIIVGYGDGKIGYWEFNLSQLSGQSGAQQQQSSQQQEQKSQQESSASPTVDGRPNINSKAYEALGVLDNAAPRSILGVSAKATPVQIREAYQALAANWHPDKNDKPIAKDVFLLIKWAYDELQKP
jgi:WD40 repeat protein